MTECFTENTMVCTNKNRNVIRLERFVFPNETCEHHTFRSSQLLIAHMLTEIPKKCSNCLYYEDAINSMKR